MRSAVIDEWGASRRAFQVPQVGPLAWVLGKPTSAMATVQQMLLVAVLSLCLYTFAVAPFWTLGLITEALRPRWVAVMLVPPLVYAPFGVVVSAFAVAWITGHRLAPLLMTLALVPPRVVLLVLFGNVDLLPALLAQGPLGAAEFVGAAAAVVLGASPLCRGPADWRTVGKGVVITGVVAVFVTLILSTCHVGLMMAERSNLFDALPFPNDFGVPLGLLLSLGLVSVPVLVGSALIRPGGLVAGWTGAVLGAVPYGVGIA
ncbi:MAG: hypothetical protein KC912_26205, partial [Proteobacteria bacterium]|nr:hypothetical protein [Pseudomonadota bacterium]